MPVNVILFGEKVFVDVIEWRIFEMSSSLINWLNPKSSDKYLLMGQRRVEDYLTMEGHKGYLEPP